MGGDIIASGSISGDLYLNEGATTAITPDGDRYCGDPPELFPLCGSGSFTIPDPCDCEYSELIDVTTGIIEAHACDPEGSGAPACSGFECCDAGKNHNALVGLDPRLLDEAYFAGRRRVDLPCGHYYFTQIDQPNDDVTLFVHGRAAIYVGGHINVGQDFSLLLGDDAEVDLFVKGGICIGGTPRLGSMNFPARTRIYVGGGVSYFGPCVGGQCVQDQSIACTEEWHCGPAGGSNTSCESPQAAERAISIPNAAHLAANLYAPWGALHTTQQVILFGSLFVREYDVGNQTSIHFDAAVLNAGADCPTDCGNGIIDSREVCDGSALGGQTCVTQGLGGGTLLCKETCDGYELFACWFCGDGVVDPGEDCEPALGPGTDCAGLGYTAGSLLCGNDCRHNPADCSLCGNGLVEPGEICDSDQMGTATCQSMGFDGGTLFCNAGCDGYQTSGCYECGGGSTAVDPGEQCDPNVPLGLDCSAFGYDAGTPVCRADCTVDLSDCRLCGNLTREDGEDCDGTDIAGLTCLDFGLEGWDGGRLGCTTDCRFDTSACTRCGDGQVHKPEQCEPGDSGDCADFGYRPQGVSCKDDCRFDLSACQPLSSCGNGIREDGELCDGEDLPVPMPTCAELGFSHGDMGAGCQEDCTFDTSGCSTCGNGVAEGAEECDGSDPPLTCADLPQFEEGVLACRSDCLFDVSDCSYCGNGVAEGAEECDEQDFRGAGCHDFSTYTNGDLVCRPDCTIDTGGCYFCGDDSVDPGEECDPPGTSQTCSDIGLGVGILLCRGTCLWDRSRCEYCGNGVVEPGEHCDGTNLVGETCASRGFTGGSLACAGCALDESGCTLCGDGAVQSGEDCDGTVLPGDTCITQGFTSGTLRCSPNCTFDRAGCGYCGDGLLNGDEQCDGDALEGRTCASLGPGEAGVLRCNDASPDECTFDASGCTRCGDGTVLTPEQCEPGDTADCADFEYQPQVDGVICIDCRWNTDGCSVLATCGDGALNGAEQCDDSGTPGTPADDVFQDPPLVCTDLGYTGGSIGEACRQDCTVDTSACTLCGNHLLEPPEICDGTDLGGLDCADFGFAGGTVGCHANCDGFDLSGCAECASCRDCPNQACKDGRCAACEESPDCCPPLICNDGACILVPW